MNGKEHISNDNDDVDDGDDGDDHRHDGDDHGCGHGDNDDYDGGAMVRFGCRTRR